MRYVRIVKLLVCRASLKVFLSVGLLFSSSGCATLANANAAHSRISPCVSDISFAVTDLVLAGAATGILAASGALDDSPAWMAVPGVFVASGVLGGITVNKCRAKEEGNRQEGQPAPVYDRGPEYTPQPARASDLPDATPEEIGLELPSPTAPAVDPRLQLSPESKLKEAPPPKPEEAAAPTPEGGKIACGFELPVTCPQGTVCILTTERAGFCIKEREQPTAPPKTELPPM